MFSYLQAGSLFCRFEAWVGGDWEEDIWLATFAEQPGELGVPIKCEHDWTRQAGQLPGGGGQHLKFRAERPKRLSLRYHRILGNRATLVVMIVRSHHQSHAPQISSVTASNIKLPGTVGPTARSGHDGWSSDIGRREISCVPLLLPFLPF